MMRSLFAGVSGLTSHQTRMDVIGNNIANVNTIGFKKSRVTFQDMLSQTLQAGSAPSATRGGVNPVQVGLGVQLGTIDVIHTEGATEPTGVQTDMSIRGNGFFVLLDGQHQLFTRAGAFDVEEAGWLASKATGIRVAGWNANNLGDINTNAPLEQIQIPTGQTVPAKSTALVELEGNLNATTVATPTLDPDDGPHESRTIDVVDSLGVYHRVIIDFQKVDDNEWSWRATDEGGTELAISGYTYDPTDPDTWPRLHFTSSGELDLGLSQIGTITFQGQNGAEDVEFDVDFGRISQYGADTALSMRRQDGYSSGTLEEVRISNTGVLTGIFSNGLTRDLAQLALATFSNNGGLLRTGETMFQESRNSGIAQIGAAGTADRGDVTPGTLEMSNVDLSEEFTSMIITQRGFQANSRIITTSDEMLQELVNLKR